MKEILPYDASFPICVKAKEFSSAILSEDGSLIAQSLGSPFHFAALRAMIKEALAYFSSDLEDGDVIIMNDPYQGGIHVQDFIVFMPTFYNGELILFPVVGAHLLDYGGGVASSYNPKASEIWQEGVRVTPVKLYKTLVKREEVETTLMMNSRLDFKLKYVFEFMMKALLAGREGILKLLRRYGKETISQNIHAVIEHTEKRLRAQISKLPEGVYEGESFGLWGDSDVLEIRVHTLLEKEGDELCVNLEGTDPQVNCFLNSSLNNTISLILIAIVSILDWEIPKNEGLFRALKIKVPPGTVVNPNFPAAVGWGPFQIGCCITEAITKALEKMVPEKVGAVHSKLPHLLIFWGQEKRRPIQIHPFMTTAGGASGTFLADGWGFPAPLSGMLLPSIEETETSFPLQLIEREILINSGGPGKSRGTDGMRASLIFLESASISLFMDRGTNPGYFGGKPGTPSLVQLISPSQRIIEVKSTLSMEKVEKGTKLIIQSGGGGGFGE